MAFNNPPTSENEIRGDALENREELLISAKKAFATYGPEASLSKIAQNAGLSRATLYRNFSDRKTLILTVLEQNINILERQAEELAGTEKAFVELLRLVLNQQIEFQPLVSFLDDSVAKHLRQRVIKAFEQPIQEAKSSGRLKPSFYTKDVLLIIDMLGGVLSTSDSQKQKAQAKKALSFLLDGICCKHL